MKHDTNSILQQISAMTSSIEGRNAASKIKLPKLSFNDILSAQKSSQEDSNSKILIQENFAEAPGKLFSEHILGTSRSVKNLAPSILRFPKVQLIRDSELASTVESQLHSIQKRVPTEEDLVNYFPVRASKSSERFPNFPTKINIKSNREHAIDNNVSLADNFRKRKLILKAWKTVLISRMHTIHKQHTEKLS